MFNIPAVTWTQASPALRARFLHALDRRAEAASNASARDLTGCGNCLPGETCLLLGLAPGSTYGDAAALIAKAEAQAQSGVSQATAPLA